MGKCKPEKYCDQIRCLWWNVVCACRYCKFTLSAGLLRLLVVVHCFCMPLLRALSFLFVTMGRKKILGTCDPLCKSDAACRQKRSKAKQSASNRHWLSKLLHWLWLLVLLWVWLLFVVLLLLLRPFL